VFFSGRKKGALLSTSASLRRLKRKLLKKFPLKNLFQNFLYLVREAVGHADSGFAFEKAANFRPLKYYL
jgi:hypothetical protein